MSIRKALTLAGLVLAVAALSPAPALAAKGGTDRPLKVHQSGTSVFTPTSASGGTLHSETTGVGSHLGKVSGTSDGTLTFTGPGTFTIASSFTNVAANGDEFFGTITGTGTLTAQGAEVDVVSTITGGTGRFAGASGGSIGTISSVTLDSGPPSVARTESSFKGTISY